MLKKHFPHKGFSLVEVLISLIIVTSILAAMTPIISKKLLSSGVFINVKGGGFACKDGKYLENKKCIDCPKGFFCKENEKTPCPEGQISDTAQSECTPCEDGFYANENQDKCVKCEEGYQCTNGIKTVCPDGSYSSAGQAFCTPCPDGFYCKDGEKKSCETKFTNCNICNNSSCLSCKTGYEVKNGKCVLKGFSQTFCDSLGSNLLYLTASQNGGTAACVTKANVGDTYAGGPEIPASAGVTVVNAGSSCVSGMNKCCWSGNNVGYTANSSYCTASGNGDSTYSGCKRTLCNLNAAKLICKNWEPSGSNTKGKWRLPTHNELYTWKDSMDSIQKNQGKNGLQLCDRFSNGGSVSCDHINTCKGAWQDYCYPYMIWSSSTDGVTGSPLYFMLIQDKFTDDNGAIYSTAALSARCVLDEKTYFGTSSGSSSGGSSSGLPKTLTSQADCDKFGKNLLFLTSSQNGGKAACVTKANVGDINDGGPDLSKIKSEAGINFKFGGMSCGSSQREYSRKCCWYGLNHTMSDDCTSSGNGDSEYSGCSRTSCTWAAAKAACEVFEPDGSGTKGKWRLPTRNELSAWGNNLSSIQKNQGKNGLQLCDLTVDYLGSVKCAYGYSCNSPDAARCYSSSIWAIDEYNSKEAYHYELDYGDFNEGTEDKSMGHSARCVLDEDAVKSL